VGKNKIPKPDKPEGQQFALDSATTIHQPENLIVQSSGTIVQGDGGFITAAAFNEPGTAGEEAAITYDPMQLPGPSSGYFLLNYVDGNGVRHDEYPISATLSTSNSGDFAAVEFMALDSRFGPTYPSNPGDPVNNLWTLTISAQGPITSARDLSVSFTINPLAAGILTDSSGSPLSQRSVLNRVLGALSVKDGVATLAPVDPFPVGTEYHVPFGTTITYGVADGAALTTATPEPASVWLLGLVALGLLGYGWRRCKRIAL
jgi:hypothetical protein